MSYRYTQSVIGEPSRFILGKVISYALLCTSCLSLCLSLKLASSYAQAPAVDCSSLEKAFQAANYKVKNSYRKSRKLLFSQVAPQTDGGQITALYTGRKTPARRRKAPHGYNCEHLFPRAWMSRKGSRAYKQQEADLHNLYPSEIKINSRRGHLPFGMVGKQHFQNCQALLLS